MHIQNSVILITGATAGIGAAIATELARHGATLVLTGRRLERLEDLQSKIRPNSEKILLLAGDIRDEPFCRSLIEETINHFGRIDVLINNAGIGHSSHLKEIPTADFKALWETNVYALSWLSQAAVQVMEQQTVEGHTQKRGQIINVSSIIEDRPLINQSIYSASKAAVNHYSRGLRMEQAESDITVSILYPGLTNTEFHQAKLGSKTGPQVPNMGIDPAEVAKRVKQAIIRQKQEIYVTWYDLFFVQANRHFAWLTDYLFRYVANGKKKA